MSKNCSQSRKSIVEQAINFTSPLRIPIWFINCDQTGGDVLIYHLSLGRKGDGSGNDWDWTNNEWGYRLEKLNNGTMGHPKEPFLPDWQSVEKLQPPGLREKERFASLPQFLTRCEDRYRLASLDLSGFTVYTMIRGFENSMEDPYLEPERFSFLLDLIFDFECDLIRLYAQHGFHGIHFADYCATQRGMMISPDSWRELYKPRYKRQFALAHEMGLHVWFHCCGNFAPIAGDFHDIGVDVLNISQPNVFDFDSIASRQTVFPDADQLPDGIHHRHSGRDLYGSRKVIQTAWDHSRRFHRVRRRIQQHGYVATELPGLRRSIPAAATCKAKRMKKKQRRNKS